MNLHMPVDTKCILTIGLYDWVQVSDTGCVKYLVETSVTGCSFFQMIPL